MQPKGKDKRNICSICRHRKRAEIDRAVLDKVSLRTIAQQYGTSAAVLCRHKPHIATEVMQVKQSQEQARAGGLAEYFEAFLERAETLEAAVLAVLKEAQQSKDRTGTLAAVREAVNLAKEMRAHRELLAKGIGELREQHIGDNLTINVVYLPNPATPQPGPAEIWDVVDVSPQQR